MKFVRSILSLIGFYLLFWIAKSIYHSFLTGDSKIETITMIEWWIAGISAIIVIIINAAFIDERDETPFSPGTLVLVLTFLATFLPFSWGFIVLYNLGVAGSIVWSIYQKP